MDRHWVRVWDPAAMIAAAGFGPSYCPLYVGGLNSAVPQPDGGAGGRCARHSAPCWGAQRRMRAVPASCTMAYSSFPMYILVALGSRVVACRVNLAVAVRGRWSLAGGSLASSRPAHRWAPTPRSLLAAPWVEGWRLTPPARRSGPLRRRIATPAARTRAFDSFPSMWHCVLWTATGAAKLLSAVLQPLPLQCWESH